MRTNGNGENTWKLFNSIRINIPNIQNSKNTTADILAIPLSNEPGSEQTLLKENITGQQTQKKLKSISHHGNTNQNHNETSIKWLIFFQKVKTLEEVEIGLKHVE